MAPPGVNTTAPAPAIHSVTHFDRRTSKLPQTGQLWCWTSNGVSQARQMYGGSSLPSEIPDTSFALSRTPIATTSILRDGGNKKRVDSLRHFLPVPSRGLPVCAAPVSVTAPVDDRPGRRPSPLPATTRRSGALWPVTDVYDSGRTDNQSDETSDTYTRTVTSCRSAGPVGRHVALLRGSLGYRHRRRVVAGGRHRVYHRGVVADPAGDHDQGVRR